MNLEEGSICPYCRAGVFEYVKTNHNGCSCHLGGAPCSWCTSDELFCDYCGNHVDEVYLVMKKKENPVDIRTLLRQLDENRESMMVLEKMILHKERIELSCTVGNNVLVYILDQDVLAELLQKEIDSLKAFEEKYSSVLELSDLALIGMNAKD